VGCWQLDRYSSNQFDQERDNKCYNSISLQAFFCLSPGNLNAPFCQDISTVSQKERSGKNSLIYPKITYGYQQTRTCSRCTAVVLSTVAVTGAGFRLSQSQAFFQESPKETVDEVWQIINRTYLDGTFNQSDGTPSAISI